MNLNNPSGFTLAQFKKVLENQNSDKNSVFAQNAEYFYYAEKQYSINGIFLAAVAIHESGWGTSAISVSKKNLFGYGAVDSNPSGGAYSFDTYAEGIDLLARVFKKYYLNPEGTAIYDGNVANGKFYNGNTLTSINIKYASDKNWANSVFKWMQYLYNSL
jgi:beta-N-acetylglucosaminidase